MNMETPIEQFYEPLIPILKELNRKLTKDLVVRGSRPMLIPTNTGVADPDKKLTKASFYDPRFPHMEPVGTIKYSDGAYVVSSRLIENEKYRAHSNEYHTRKSKSDKNTVKTALSFITPFGFGEVMENNYPALRSLIHEWRYELASKCRVAYIGAADAELFEEVGNMLNNGVVFNTNLFKDMAAKYPIYLECTKRVKAEVHPYHVYFLADGRVAVSTLPDLDKADDHTVGKHAQTTVYNSSDEVPEGLTSKCALLKVMGGPHPKIPAVGVGTTPQEFYLMDIVGEAQ